ncbi:MAG: hypothetical protein ACFFFT_00330 [Candidatus Thorarchaeota archaeon]
MENYGDLIVRLYTKAENKTLLQVASEELLTTMQLLKETNNSQLIMNRMLLIINILNKYPADFYTRKGVNVRNLASDKKLACHEILRDEFLPN